MQTEKKVEIKQSIQELWDNFKGHPNCKWNIRGEERIKQNKYSK